MTIDICAAKPRELFDTVVCLEPVSKDAQGELHPLVAEPQVCRESDCKTLKTIHALRVRLSSHPCDRALGATLDGDLVVMNLTTAFVDGDGQARGTHLGDFRWSSPAALIVGTLSGMTNVGTHRAPVFEPVQECASRGYLEGRLCGQVRRTADHRLSGCEVEGVYRFRFDPTAEGGAGGIAGTIEGVIVCECPRQPHRCLEWTTAGTGNNPRIEGDVTFEIRTSNGTLVPASQVRTQVAGGPVGLDVSFSTRVLFASPVDRVEATLVHYAQPATITAFNAAGNPLGSAMMTPTQGALQTLTLLAAAIVRVEITCPNDEVLLTRLCYERRSET
jgi:hypothetical protein